MELLASPTASGTRVVEAVAPAFLADLLLRLLLLSSKLVLHHF
uniref:Uncharacterized protein n=1 Tax=Arundo donax TaxID=35708 RepID=A0A0A9FB05_ARUDO